MERIETAEWQRKKKVGESKARKDDVRYFLRIIVVEKLGSLTAELRNTKLTILA